MHRRKQLPRSTFPERLWFAFATCAIYKNPVLFLRLWNQNSKLKYFIYFTSINYTNSSNHLGFVVVALCNFFYLFCDQQSQHKFVLSFFSLSFSLVSGSRSSPSIKSEHKKKCRRHENSIPHALRHSHTDARHTCNDDDDDDDDKRIIAFVSAIECCWN